jgi:hypothetical protein
MGQTANDMVPGTSAHNNGIRATTFHDAICKPTQPVQCVQLAYGECAARESRPRKKPDGVGLDYSVVRCPVPRIGTQRVCFSTERRFLASPQRVLVT